MGGVGRVNLVTGQPRGADRCALTVLVPAFNEGSIVTAHLQSIHSFLKNLSPATTWEMLIIDDGSSDETGALAKEFAAANESVRVVQHEQNRGLGGALRTGFALAKGEVIIPLDIDLSYSLEHLTKLFDTYSRSGADIVLLSPYMPRGRVSQVPMFRRLMSRGANQFLSWCQAGRLHTSTGMVRAYNKALLNKLALHSEGMEINLEILYQALLAGAKVKEIPAHLQWRLDPGVAARVSSVGPVKVVRQMALVAQYAVRFLRARRAIIQGVVQ